MSKLKAFLLTGLLAVAVAPLYGCGSECGPGTTEQDGQCVLVAKGCGGGTILTNSQCIIDTSGCGEGTVLDGTQCMPHEDTCAEGTTFDVTLKVCVTDTDIVCGDATEANDDGLCVPSGDACGDKTVMDNGRCIIEAATCGQGTELEANSGLCVLADAACGEGLALGDSGTCETTDSVCASGTIFDTGSGLCLPDACQEGDVLTNGVCMDPVEQIAHDADLFETENNDPTLGGTAESLTVNPVDEAFTFAGAIGAPTDLDGDSKVDQDVDVFEFDASAGDWLQIGVQSNGLPMPAFVVEGPNGYMRWSETNLAAQTARHIVVPEDGTYSVSVLPSLSLQNPEVGPSGADDWGYVGTLKAIDAPSATSEDLTGGAVQLSGQFSDLSDNLFSLTGVTGDDVLTFTVDTAGAHAEGVLQVWADATTLHESQPISAGDKLTVGVPATGNATVLVDWTNVYGADQDYSVSVAITGEQRQLTIPAGSTETVTVTLSQFDRIVASQQNPSGDALDLALFDDTSTEIASATLAPGVEFDPVVFADGDYTIEATNNTSADLSVVIFLDVVPPVDLGAIAADSSAASPAASLTSGDKIYYVMSALAGEVVSVSHDNDQAEEIDYVVYGPTGTVIDSGTDVEARSDATDYSYDDVIWRHLDADATFLIEVTATAGMANHILDVESQTPANAGTLDESSTVSMSRATLLDAGYSEFHLVDVPAATSFYGTLSPGGGESVGFSLYDDAGVAVSNESGTGDLSFSGSIDTAGTYLVRVAADEATSSYDLSLNGIIDQENLGTLVEGTPAVSTTLPVFNRDQTMTLNFTAPAGHVIEISHDNAEAGDHEAFLYDDQGTELASTLYFYPTSDTGNTPTYLNWYTENGGDFEFKLEGWSATTSESIKVRVFQPGDLGQVGPGNTTKSVADSVLAGQTYFRFIEFTEGLQVNGVLSPNNAEALDITLRDSSGSAVISESGSGSDVSFSGDIAAGTYMLEVEAQEAATGFGLVFDGYVNVVDVDLSGTTRTYTSPTMPTFARNQTFTVNLTVPAGSVIEAFHTNNEAEDHEGYLYDAQDTEVQNHLYFYASNDTTDTPTYIYWYSHDGGTYKFVMEGWTDPTTDEVLTLNVITPDDLGVLDANSPVTTTEPDTKSLGQAYFKRVDLAGALTFDATLSPTGAEDLNLELADTENTPVLSEDGIGGDILLTDQTVLTAGTYVVRIDADEDATGFTLTLDNATSIEESLGTIASNASQTSSTLATFDTDELRAYTFTVSANQVIELSHDNATDGDHRLRLFGPNGDELFDESNVYPASNVSPDYVYWYSETGGTYTAVLEAGADVTDQTLTVDLSTPTDLGTVAVGASTSHTSSAGLSIGKSEMFLVTLDDVGLLSAETVVPGSEDTDVYVYDLQMSELASEVSTSPANLGLTELAAGTYLLEVAAPEATASYDLNVAVDAALGMPDFSSAPALAIPDGTGYPGVGPTVSDSLTVSASCTAIAGVLVYVDISHTFRGDLLVELVSPGGTRVTLQDRTGGSSADILGWYPIDFPVDGPGSLSDYTGEAADGVWTIEANDNYTFDAGTLNEWGVTFTCQ